MKFVKIILIIFLLTNNLTSFSQRPSYDSLKNLLAVDKKGKGNSGFNLTLSKLESIIKSGITLNSFENQFADWTSYSSDNDIGYKWDDNTKAHSIPFFQILYRTTIKDRYYIIRVEVVNDLKNKIDYLEIITELNGIKLAEFKKALSSNGYLINENLTSIFKKQTWQHKTKKLMVTIKSNANGTHSIGIR